MTLRRHPTHIKKELDRLEKSGKEFNISDVAHKLNTTPQLLAFELRQRENAVCIYRPKGACCGKHPVYKFIKKQNGDS